MAVFREKNGVWKPGGYPYRWTGPRVPPGRHGSGRDISQHPESSRVSERLFSSLADARNVRALAASRSGSIRKGGASKRTS